MRNLLFAVVVLVAAGAAAFWFYSSNSGRPQASEFAAVGELAVDGNAEIVAASPDGMLLAHTNTKQQSVDLVNISDPAAPVNVGRIAVPGEPTSVAVSPDGLWALATLNLSESKTGSEPLHPRIPGGLAIIDIADSAAPLLSEIIGIGHHPDSIAVAASGADLVAVVAIENEPVVIADGVVTDHDTPGNPNDISLPGKVQVITFNPLRQDNYRVASLDLSQARLEEAGLEYPGDAQPEFVALSPDLSLAAVSLQENNGIVVFDPYWLETRRMFSTGRVALRKADLRNDGTTRLNDDYPEVTEDQPHTGKRFPDGVTFTPSGDYLLSADEGEMPLTGGRGISLWSLDGELIWEDGGEIEAAAAAAGLYPDYRSSEKGIEIEGVAAARFDTRDFAFAAAERGGFVAVYDITDPMAPEFVQLLRTGSEPESVVAIPRRGLLAVAAEGSGSIHLYQRTSMPESGVESAP